jgi:FdhD protein
VRRGEYRVAGEEPLEIRLGTRADEPVSVNVTMRTPGDDFDLAVGWCVTEGLLPQPVELHEVKYCVKSPSVGDVGEAQEYNVVSVVARHVHGVSRRTQVTTASCGICGTESLDALELRTPTIDPASGPLITAAMLVGLPDQLRKGQKTFDETGGTHAAGLFTSRGDVVVLREDVGRHNAVDKVIGHAAVAGRLPLDAHVLMVSGRVSFEIVQKAAMARIAVLAAVSAPTTLAIDAADRMGITLATFVRGDTATIWTHPHRVG